MTVADQVSASAFINRTMRVVGLAFAGIKPGPNNLITTVFFPGNSLFIKVNLAGTSGSFTMIRNRDFWLQPKVSNTSFYPLITRSSEFFCQGIRIIAEVPC